MMKWINARWKTWVSTVPPAVLILLNSIYDLGLTTNEQMTITLAISAVLVHQAPNVR